MSSNSSAGSALVGATVVGIAALIIILLVTLLLGIGPWVTVPEGNVGVQTEKQAATGDVYEPGWHLQLPIVQGYEEVETRPRITSMQDRDDDAIYVITHDGQDVWVDVTVRYRVDPDNAVEFYREYRNHGQAIDRVIDPTVRSDLRDEASDLSAREIITRDGRLALEEAAEDALRENFQGTGLTLEAVQVRGVDLNEEFSAELEQIEIEETRAEQRLIEAEGIAEAEIAEAEGAAEAYEIRDEALTEAVLQEHYIDQIDESTIIIEGDGGTPVILNLDGDEGEGE